MIEWADTMTPQLRRILEKSLDVTEDAAEGGDYILEGALKRVPKESGDLAASGRVDKERGRDNEVGITFDGPYARWIHEHLYFKHPRGGQAKFLERAMVARRKGAVQRAFKHFWGRL